LKTKQELECKFLNQLDKWHKEYDVANVEKLWAQKELQLQDTLQASAVERLRKAKKPAYTAELFSVRQLVRYFDRSPDSGIAESLPGPVASTVLPRLGSRMKPRSERSLEPLFAGLSNIRTVPLREAPQYIRNCLVDLAIEPPASEKDIPAFLENLYERQRAYLRNQDRMTQRVLPRLRIMI